MEKLKARGEQPVVVVGPVYVPGEWGTLERAQVDNVKRLKDRILQHIGYIGQIGNNRK